MRERIRALTGATRATPTGLQAEGTITQTDRTHFHLKLVTRSGGLVGERSLSASSCENLTGAAAVSLALLMRSSEPLSERELAGKPIDGSEPAGATATGAVPTANPTSANGTSTTSGSTPTNSEQAKNNGQSRATAQDTSTTASATGARKQSKASAQGASQAPEDAESSPSEIIERPIRPSSERKVHALVELPLAAMSLGPLPRPSWGVAFAAGASFENWRLLLGGTAWLRQHVPSEQSPEFGADVDRLSGTFRACHTVSQSKFEVAPCLVLSLEHVAARGTGDGVHARSEQATWLAVGAGAQGRLHLNRSVALLLGLDAQIQTGRPVVSIDGVGEVKQLGFAAFTATIGPEWML